MFIPPVGFIVTEAGGQHAAWKPFESLDLPLFGVMVGCIAAASRVGGGEGWEDFPILSASGWRRQIENGELRIENWG